MRLDHLDTARTVGTFPFPGTPNSFGLPAGALEGFQTPVSNSATGMLGPSVGLDIALSNASECMGEPLASNSTLPFLAPWLPLKDEAQKWRGATLGKFILQTSATESSGLKSNTPVHWTDRTDMFAFLIVAAGSQALASKDAKEHLSSARAAACANEFRTAYYHAFRGLDLLLRNGRWKQASEELQDICSGKYPVTFALGAMRFASGAAERIPNWNAVLKSLMTTAQEQNVDVRRAMRGLVETNGAA